MSMLNYIFTVWQQANFFLVIKVSQIIKYALC